MLIATAILVSLLLVLQPSRAYSGEVLNFPTAVSTSNYAILTNTDLTAAAQEFTVCAWLRPTVIDDWNGIFSYATSSVDNMIVITPDHVRVHNSGVKLDTILEIGVWSHMCATWDYQSYKWYAYINGTFIQSRTTNQTPIPSGGTIVIGQEQDSVGGGFAVADAYGGDIYDLNVLDKRLTDSEVKGLYDLGLCGSGVNEDFSDRIVVSWEDVLGAPRYGGVTVQLAEQCVLDLLQSKLVEKEKLLNDTQQKLLDTKVELNTTKLEVTLLEGELREANILFNSTQQELETAKMRLNSSSCNQKLTKAELKLTNALEEMSRPVSHWDILFNQEYLNKKLTETHLENLKNGWKHLEDFVDVNITENVIQHFKTYHADDQDTTCSTTCDCDCDSEK